MPRIQPFSGFFFTLAVSITASLQAQEIPAPRNSIEKITPASLAEDYKLERSYRPDKEKQPTIGLALSGGGTKAAMFAHGVLHGLHDAGVLEQVDAISSVSGGSYAAYWYFTKMLESKRHNFTLSQIFDDCIPTYWTKDDKPDSRLQQAMQAAKLKPPVKGMSECDGPAHFRAMGNLLGTDDPYRWQAHIVRWPDVIQPTPVYLNGGLQGAPEQQMRRGVLNALTKEVALHAFGSASAVPRIYQYGIERTWGLSPKPRDVTKLSGQFEHDETEHWKYTNAGTPDTDVAKRGIRVDPGTTTWSQLHDLYSTAAAPAALKIMPLWIVNSTNGNKSWEPNTQNIFEMTPFGYGSIRNGYINDFASMPIKDLGTSVRASAGFADAQGIENKVEQTVVDKFSNGIPALRWGVDATMQSSQGTVQELHLSDGGGSENLGLYSLLKRGFDDIIVVDTAADVEGDMSDICTVRKALQKENITLEFDALQHLKDVCEGQPQHKPKRVYNLSAWKNPVVKGTATWPAVDGAAPRIAHIWLIKAAWDERAIAQGYPDKCGEKNQVNCFLEVFYGHNTKVRAKIRGKKDGWMIFPQLGTVASTYNSSSYLFWGYRELGRMLASHLSVNTVGHLELDTPQCLQVDLKRAKGRRPEDFELTPPTACKTVL
ncbi:patatin-like phospholipase family protein [Collimonas sp. OK412]|jgi:predicted acylesterase/phospholipase RssA|uniref:patatin-like phospholipase family protein n=1 Tax=Collimonas sp. (strain OK412) TaxID=1801619 RepID=UPI0008E27FF1|nr:patatin-like phospholipase family protein [Collimonas sp. OK412]SFB69112.1 Patatin-like phospholipase [Collimonas sp. OK412]